MLEEVAMVWGKTRTAHLEPRLRHWENSMCSDKGHQYGRDQVTYTTVKGTIASLLARVRSHVFAEYARGTCESLELLGLPGKGPG